MLGRFVGRREIDFSEDRLGPARRRDDGCGKDCEVVAHLVRSELRISEPRLGLQCDGGVRSAATQPRLDSP